MKASKFASSYKYYLLNLFKD